MYVKMYIRQLHKTIMMRRNHVHIETESTHFEQFLTFTTQNRI